MAINETHGTPLRTLQINAPASTAIAVGDLLYNNAGTLALASAQADAGTESANQQTFAALFAGVSQEQRLSTETTVRPIVVVADGIFDANCASTTWAVGDLIGPKEQSNGTQLENQVVAKVTNSANAIGVCIQAATSSTKVKGRLFSRLIRLATGTGALTADSLTTGLITASDASLDVNGLAAAQGGVVALTGGTSSTAGNAGGATTLTGGTGGATGAGGAVTILGGSGGGTSGTGGAVNITGGTGTAGIGGAIVAAGGAGNNVAGGGTGLAGGACSLTTGAGGTTATGTGGASGALALASGAGGAASGAGTGGAGGAVSLTGGVGGATTTSTGGAGASVTLTAGAGGAASGAGTGGAGGNVNLVAGAGGATSGGTAGADGEIQFQSAGLNVAAYTQGGLATPTATNVTFFLASRAYRIKAVRVIWDVAAGGTSTIDIFKDTSTNAIAGGTSILAAALSINSTARTVASPSLAASAATLLLAAGDRLSLKFNHTIQSTAGLFVQVELAPK